jgi:hypothetical protein
MGNRCEPRVVFSLDPAGRTTTTTTVMRLSNASGARSRCDVNVEYRFNRMTYSASSYDSLLHVKRRMLCTAYDVSMIVQCLDVLQVLSSMSALNILRFTLHKVGIPIKIKNSMISSAKKVTINKTITDYTYLHSIHLVKFIISKTMKLN